MIPHGSYLLRKVKQDSGSLEQMKLNRVNSTSHYLLSGKFQWPPEAGVTFSSLSCNMHSPRMPKRKEGQN